MSVITVDDGALVTQHPDAVKSYRFDWGSRNLAPNASITESLFGVAVVRGPNTTPYAVTPASGGIQPGNRDTIFTGSGGTPGTVYRVTNTIDDDESPIQKKPKSVDILVQA